MSGSDRQAESLVKSINSLRGQMLEHPDVFTKITGSDEGFDMPGQIAETAQLAAASREFMGELLSRARRGLAILEAMYAASEHDLSVELDQAIDGHSQRMIAGGTAWQERAAKANLSVLDRKVELRGMELRVRNAKSQVREIEDCYQAWRDTEWALDRQVRLLQLRHAIGEV